MAGKTTTAPADAEMMPVTKLAKAKPSGPTVIKGARIQRMKVGAISAPALIFKGGTLPKGAAIRATIGGTTYTAKIDECEEVDGEIVATLKAGLTPATK